MRDDRNFTTQHRMVKKLVETGSIATTNLTRQVARTRRDDAIPTTPVGGVYMVPTSYGAIFAFTSAVATSGVHKEHLWPYTGNWRTYEWSADGGQDRAVWRHGCNAVSLEPDIPTSVLSQNREKVWAQIRNNDLNLGQTIGELRESINTITTLLRDVVALGRALSRPDRTLYELGFRHIRDAQRNMRNYAQRRAASEYMRYMWGIRPMMSDIFAIADRVANGLGSGNFGTVSAVTLDGGFNPSTVYPTFPERWFEGEMVRGVELSVTIRLTNAGWFNAWRYGLTNPLSVAWEVTPLSFVVDWFLHLGGFLAALGGPLGIDFAHGYETRFLRISGTYKERYTPNPVPNRIVVVREGVYEVPIRTRSMKRERLIGIPVPLPYLDLGLNLNQAAGLLALIASGRFTSK